MTQSHIADMRDIPERLRALADEIEAMGEAVRHFGGFGAIVTWGRVLELDTAPLCRHIAEMVEHVQAIRRGEA